MVRKIQGTFEVIWLGVGGLSCLVMYLAASMKYRIRCPSKCLLMARIL